MLQADVEPPGVADPASVALWSREFFRDVAGRLLVWRGWRSAGQSTRVDDLSDAFAADLC